MFHHLTFPSALHFYIELHTHTHTCLVFLFERFTGADRSSLCCRSLWNRDNSVMRDSWEVRGPGQQSRNSLQVLNHHMEAKKGDNEQWVGWARMLFRNWKGRKYSMVNVYDHHNCESTWHQPCIQIYYTKKEPYNHLFQTNHISYIMAHDGTYSIKIQNLLPFFPFHLQKEANPGTLEAIFMLILIFHFCVPNKTILFSTC